MAYKTPIYNTHKSKLLRLKWQRMEKRQTKSDSSLASEGAAEHRLKTINQVISEVPKHLDLVNSHKWFQSSET